VAEGVVEALFQTVLILIALLAAVSIVARRLKVAPAILLMLAGVALAFVPGMPAIELAPDLVLLIVLPPLIYSAGVSMSWREFRNNLRPIGLLAIGCVAFTTCAVALAVHYLLGLPWGVGFVLGAIVSPPDIVAPLAIARRLRLPRRLLVVLEGEGLANDATALVLYRYAVAAVATGLFSLPAAAGNFALIFVGEILFGVAVGWLSLHLRKWARDPRVEITLSLLIPYLAFWVPEHLGGSGVLATVATGLYVSWNGPLLISSATRLQGIFFWDLVIYLIEGLLFLLVGFELKVLLQKANGTSLPEVLIAVALVSAIVIIARFAWVFPATYLPRWMSRSLAARDPSPDWKIVFVLAFTGVRGAVSLAAALALPLTLPGGAAFPYRDLILFVAFGVIVVTVVGLGLSLPWVVKLLGIAHVSEHEHRDERDAELKARRDALEAARRSLETLTQERRLAKGVVDHLQARHAARLRQLPDDSTSNEHMALSVSVQRELIETERAFLYSLLKEGRITDETRRRLERDLDLEEASLGNRAHDGGPL
jgi:CPA1 family monovalent cation:H+ antiporter